LGSEKQVFDGVFSYYNNTTTHLNVSPYGQYFELVVDAVYGGRYVVNNNLLTKRTSVVRPNMLIVGDILIAAADVKAANCTVYMMLDSGCLMELDNSGGAKILSAAESEDILMKVLAKHAFVLLRPSYGM
ncbi:MAG: hypothetical protein IKZ15_02460, partial [Clostridia bacterium]|nr:hypothetical protein [Clostridia bacterium]